MEKKGMKTGMVILNYNDYENTIKMIEQIKDYRCLNKIIIVDNCSTDKSVSKITPFLNKKIILLEAKKNKGYAAGNNLGLKYLAKETACELAIVSNPDVLIMESVLNDMIKDMKQNPEISFLGPKILENGHITKGWKLPSFSCELLATMNYFNRFSFGLQKYADTYYKDGLNEVEVLHGCFFMMRLKDMKKIKYFDEGTFLYYEENILAKKAQDKGLKSYVDTRLSVQHLQSKSVDKSMKKISKYKALKKSMFYYEKNFNHRNILALGLLKLFYYVSVCLLYFTFWI